MMDEDGQQAAAEQGGLYRLLAAYFYIVRFVPEASCFDDGYC